MSIDPPGPLAPKASVNAPRAGAGPKRTPRPERARSNDATTVDTVTDAPPARPVSPAQASPADVRAALQETFAPTPKPVADEAPVVVPAPSGRRVRRGRRVKRVVRRIDLWSVLKLSLVVYTCIYLSILATLAALWGLLYSSGSVEKLQSFLADVGLENFTFYGNQMFRAAAAIGAIGVLAGTVITVLSTALVNVISEMTGGIRLVVIEEDVDR